jgi:hypothetical protein
MHVVLGAFSAWVCRYIGTGWPDKCTKKSPQQIAQRISCHYKSSTLAQLLLWKNVAQSKQSSKRRKFAQSGLRGWEIESRRKVPRKLLFKTYVDKIYLFTFCNFVFQCRKPQKIEMAINWRMFLRERLNVIPQFLPTQKHIIDNRKISPKSKLYWLGEIQTRAFGISSVHNRRN